MINLYPYNLYILYAALAVLLVYIILTLMHLSKLANAAKGMQENMISIQKRSEKLTQTVQILTPKKKKKNRISPAMIHTFLTLIHATYKDYKQDSKKGIREFTQLAVRKAADKNAKQMLSRQAMDLFR